MAITTPRRRVGAPAMPAHRDTIFALSSGRPPAAIAVVRLSGPRAAQALCALAGRLPRAREATLARVRCPESREIIDEALALWFPGPDSETGEDVAELQIHGGRAVISATLSALGKLPGLRPAEAGEFTRRAFENGRMDLPAVEGLADLVAAETEAQRRQALQHLRGLLGQRAETWRARLVEALALVEAGIDFSDESDVPKQAAVQSMAVVAPLLEEIICALGSNSGERLREGLYVAIVGPPNVGKSTLFNRLARREAAIVSPHPGTTRDVLEIHLDLAGYPVTIVDTAGIRSAMDPVEQEGVRRAADQATRADLVLWMTEASGRAEDKPFGLAEFDLAASPHVWHVLNKIDLLSEKERSRVLPDARQGVFMLSSATGAGVEELVTAIGRFCQACFPSEPALVVRERHRRLLEDCVEFLRRAMAESEEGREEIVAEHLRLAMRALGKLLGRVDVENVLDVIFRDFCIGK
jgi:tRNA modification GTPase